MARIADAELGHGSIRPQPEGRLEPFSPEIVAEEFARLLKSYRMMRITTTVTRANGRASSFIKFGVRYEGDE